MVNVSSTAAFTVKEMPSKQTEPFGAMNGNNSAGGVMVMTVES